MTDLDIVPSKTLNLTSSIKEEMKKFKERILNDDAFAKKIWQLRECLW